MKKFLFTSESVTEGHPDKVCDLVSDSVLDALIAQDPLSRVACETVCKDNFMVLLGEVSSKASVDFESIARKAILDIGYNDDKLGFNGYSCNILVKLNNQSADIAMGVDSAVENKENSKDKYDLIGAGDQGMIFGYACDETKEFMPMPIVLAHKLTKKLTEVRKEGILDYLRPDGKAQVTVAYENEEPKYIDIVVEEPKEAPAAVEDKIVIAPEPEKVVPLPPPAPKVEKEPEVKKSADVNYHIRWGDTLWDISESYYKTPWKYPRIATYNKIKNPDLIIAGTDIKIPAE